MKYTAENWEPIKDYWMAPTGTLVSVKPCDAKFENKTFIGILIGEVPLGIRFIKIDEDTTSVEGSHHNPLIYIPEKRTTVLGAASWWRPIKSKDQIKEITTSDIQNTWYVKLLNEIINSSPTLEDEKSDV